MSNTKELLARWLEVKEAEKKSQLERIEIEALLSEDPNILKKEEGGKTCKVEGYKVTTKTGFTYSLDLEEWEKIDNNYIFDAEQNPIVSKLSVNATKAKKVKKDFPDVWLLLSQAITSKPSKVGFTVEEIEC